MIKNKQKYPLVEVMVMHHNNEKLIDDCLASLKKTKYSNLKVTVIDNASSDNSVKLVKEKYPWVNLIENKENLGFSIGYNKILKTSKAKYAVLLNDDTEQEPNWISELVKVAEKYENIAALQPKFRALKDKKMFEYAGAGGGYMDIYGYPICRGRVFDDVEEDKGQYNDIREIFWSCGGAMFLKLDVLKKIGYLDEKIGTYGEELDLCWRMNLTGYKQLFVPKSVIYHLGAGSWGRKKLQFKKNYLMHRNHWIILFKNYSKRTWLKIMPVKAILEAMAFFGFSFKQPIKSLAIAKANLWIIINPFNLLQMNKEITKIRKIDDKTLMNKMIRKSVAFDHFVLRNKRKFNDYAKYIKDYK